MCTRHARKPTPNSTLFTPDLRSDEELYRLTEKLLEGLPGRSGNTLLLLKLAVPTPSANLTFPRALRERVAAQLYLGVGPGNKKDFIRHERPGTSTHGPNSQSDPGGAVYRLRISRLPVPQKHMVYDRVAGQRR